MSVSRAAVYLCLCVSILLFAGCGSRDGDNGGDGPTPPPSPPPGFEPVAKISADPPQPDAQFGTAVAVDGDVAVVGAPFEDEGGIADRGAAYVFRFSASGTWDLEMRLAAPDGAVNDLFGFSVAVSGDQIIVGAPLRDEGGIADQGGAYVFRLTDPVTATWELTSTLIADDGAADDNFGYAVALSGEDALIGAPFRNVSGIADQGAAYIFRRTDPVTDTWEATATLTAADGVVNDRFGSSVALSGNDALVGAPFRDGPGIADQGAAYIFQRTDLLPDTWEATATLTAADGVVNDQFGSSVALSGNDALVGAPFRDGPGIADQGAAYIFRRTDLLPDTWEATATLTAADGVVNDRFGSSVALSGNDALVGAPFRDGPGIAERGAAYIFRRTDLLPDIWEATSTLTAADGRAGDRFGISVALSGDEALVGAPFAAPLDIAESGAVYPFRRP